MKQVPSFTTEFSFSLREQGNSIGVLLMQGQYDSVNHGKFKPPAKTRLTPSNFFATKQLMAPLILETRRSVNILDPIKVLTRKPGSFIGELKSLEHVVSFQIS